MGLSGPVHGFAGTANKVRAAQSDTLASRQLAPFFLPATGLLDPVQALWQAVAHPFQAVGGFERIVQQVGAPHRDGIQSQGLRHTVQQSLEGKADIDGTVTPHGPAAGIVGEYPPAFILDVGNIVKGMQQRAGIEDGDGAIAAIRATTLQYLRLHSGDAAVAFHPHPDGDIGLGAPFVGEKRLLAAQLHTHPLASGPGQQRRYHLEVQGLCARPEAAAHKRLDDPDAGGIHIQTLGQHQVYIVGYLRHRLQRQHVSLDIVFRQRRMRLHMRVGDLGAVVTLLHHQISFGKALVHIAKMITDGALGIAGALFMQGYGIIGQGLCDGEVGGQFPHVQFDQIQGPQRRCFIHRRHGGNRVATVAQFPPGQGVFQLGDRQYAERPGAIFSGDNRPHTGQSAGPGHIDIDDLGVGIGAAQYCPNQRIPGIQVRRVFCLAGHLFNPVDQRQACACRPVGPYISEILFCRLFHATTSSPSSQTARTDSIILTYPVQRQRFPSSAFLIAWSDGCGSDRNSASDAMIMPGVQKPHWVPNFS